MDPEQYEREYGTRVKFDYETAQIERANRRAAQERIRYEIAEYEGRVAVVGDQQFVQYELPSFADEDME